MIRSFLILSILAGLPACQAKDDSSPPRISEEPVTLDGTVTYRQRIALPPDATLKITLADMKQVAEAAPIIAETEIDTAGRQVPISFALDYDPKRIAAGNNYAISARITDASGQTLWITQPAVELPAPGTPVNILLTQATQ